jgi:hypothetical protein
MSLHLTGLHLTNMHENNRPLATSGEIALYLELAQLVHAKYEANGWKFRFPPMSVGGMKRLRNSAGIGMPTTPTSGNT